MQGPDWYCYYWKSDWIPAVHSLIDAWKEKGYY